MTRCFKTELFVNSSSSRLLSRFCYFSTFSNIYLTLLSPKVLAKQRIFYIPQKNFKSSLSFSKMPIKTFFCLRFFCLVFKTKNKNFELLRWYSSKKKKIKSKKKNKLKFPFFFNHLNFSQKSVLQLNKDLAVNPFFGGIRRGFPKLLPRVGLKEFNSVFLRARWYRLAKYNAFKKIVEHKKEIFEFCEAIKENTLFYARVLEKANLEFYFIFFIRKRWFLLNLLKK